MCTHLMRYVVIGTPHTKGQAQFHALQRIHSPYKHHVHHIFHIAQKILALAPYSYYRN